MQKNYITREKCPVCNSKNLSSLLSCHYHDLVIWTFLKKYYKGRIPKSQVNFNYHILKCGSCSLVFQKNILDEKTMFLLYEEWISAEESLNKKKNADLEIFKVYTYEVIAFCELLKKKPHEISALDFGMGWGFWTFLAKAMNINVKGAELSEKRINYAKTRNVEIIKDIFKERKNSYDCIYSDQVFEHLTNPLELLKELSRILKKGGVIRIKVPNGNGIERRLSKRNWKASKDSLHPLEHINCFTRKSLKILGKRAGLEVVNPPYFPRNLNKSLDLMYYLKYVYHSKFSTEIYFRKP